MSRSFTKNYYTHWVTAPFRDHIKSQYGLADDNIGPWRFMQSILLDAHEETNAESESALDALLEEEADDLNGRMRVSHSYVQHLFGNKFKKAAHQMEDFERTTGIDLDISDYSYVDGRCRTIKPTFAAETLALLAVEYSTPFKHKDKSTLVRFTTGETYSDWRERRTREGIIENLQSPPTSHPGYELAQYLHHKRTQDLLQAQVDEYGDQTWDLIQAIEEPEKRKYAERVFASMQNRGYVSYREVKKSCRIFSFGNCLLQLPRAARNSMLTGIFCCDLRMSQYVIVANLWNAPLTKTFIVSGESIWDRQARIIGRPTEEVKDALKTINYGVFYGMAEKKIRARLIRYFGNADLLKDPMIQELLAEREAQKQIIRDHGGAFDAFRKWHGLAKCAEGENYHKIRERSVRSIMCCVVQSYELRLMLGMYDYVKENPNMRIVAILHDAFYVKIVRNKRCADHYFKEMKAVPAEMAELLEMPEAAVDIKLLGGNATEVVKCPDSSELDTAA